MYQCCDYNNWKAIWIAFIANWFSGQWLWYRIIRMFGASYLFRRTSECIKTTVDWHRYHNDGARIHGVFVAAFFSRKISGNKCWSECLFNRRCNKYGKLIYFVILLLFRFFTLLFLEAIFCTIFLFTIKKNFLMENQFC